MCLNRKQFLNVAVSILTAGFTISAVAYGEEDRTATRSGGSAGGLTMGEGYGGITDRAFVTAPPNYLYVVEKERGSFLDCGEGREVRTTDEHGRDEALMRCGVTLTETVVIPAAAQSARIVIHY